MVGSALVRRLAREACEIVTVGRSELDLRDQAAAFRWMAELVTDVVGFRGRIACDTSKPDGTPRKLMSSDRPTAMGWSPRTSLRDGIAGVYAWFLAHVAEAA
jgi:nucleoside-diphosphate-sugar epimerase